jgi:hypothetical protein
MKLKLMILVALIFALPISAHAVTALEVKPQDVYRAAYCAELNRLSGFPEYEQVSETVTEKESPFEGMILSINLEPEMPEVREDPISKLAAKLITGGDNLESVDIGIEDARRDINSISSSELNQCNYDLVKILENYEWMPCGYGNLRQLNNLKAKILLLKLEMVH